MTIDANDIEAVNSAVAGLRDDVYELGGRFVWEDSPGDEYSVTEDYSPATDIAQAWELVEEMENYQVRKITDSVSSEVQYSCQIGNHLKMVHATGATDCLSICLAYIKFKEGQA